MNLESTLQRVKVSIKNSHMRERASQHFCVVRCAARRWATFYGTADKLSDTVRRERSTRGDQNPACHSSTLWPNNIYFCTAAAVPILQSRGSRPHRASCRVLALNLSGIRIFAKRKRCSCQTNETKSKWDK